MAASDGGRDPDTNALDQTGETPSPCGWAAGHTLGGLDGPVYALKTYYPNWSPSPAVLCTAGDFASAGGVTVNNVAEWDGGSWSAMSGPSGPGTNGPVYSLAVGGNLEYDYMLAGGAFSSAGGVTSGEVAIWYPGDGWYAWGDTDGEVYALATPWRFQYYVYAGGYFSEIDGVSVGSIAHCCWSALDGGVDWAVYALEEHSDGAYVGGGFTYAGGVAANNIGLWDGSSWSALTGPSGTGVGSEVFAIKVAGTDVYVGGWFSTAGGIAASNVARWDGSQWWPLEGPAGNGTDSWIDALERFNDGQGTALYVGGGFTAAGGVTSNHVARWNGSSWSALTGPYGTGTDGEVYALETHDDGNGAALYVGGSFSTAGGLPSNNIAKWVCEAMPPSDPTTLASTSHTPGTWSRETIIEVTWAGATDSGGSGVAGYSFLFDQLPATLPDPTLEVLHVGDPNSASSAALSDGDSHYFHLLTRDGSGNSSPGMHLGPFWVDATPPSLEELESSSHEVGVPSLDPTIDLFWAPAIDGASGLDGYGWEIAATAVWTCDQVKDLEEGATSLTSPPLAAGSWYAHLCAVDIAGNWSGVTSAGPFVVVSDEIFADGFESGATSAWSLAQP